MKTTQKIALITGGCGDLGFACAEKLAGQGIRIALLDQISDELAVRRVESLRRNGASVLYLQADVTNRDAVEHAIEKLWHELGQLDVCLCNAGIVVDRPFLEFTVAEWQKHLDVNLTGYFHVCQAVARRWVNSQHPGKIIFTGSWVQDVPYKLIAPYCVSKAGVWMLARCAALELAPHGITVNVVAPGIVDAGLSAKEMADNPAMRQELERLIPLGRMQTPTDVAGVVEFLVSEAANYLTGTSILCDGGCIVGSASHRS
jgi:NAD(P)-dependent dehydrogenase (short-subunit alcohol dehydrogenase family)